MQSRHVFVLLLFTVASAQNKNIGVIGGINMANVDMDIKQEEIGDYIKPENLTGFGLGGVLEFGLNENMSLCFEPMYLIKGFQQNMEEDLGIPFSFNIKGSNIEIPVLLKYYLGSGGTRPYVMVGPTIGVLLGADLGLNIMGIGFDLHVKDLLNRIDYGIGFGGGLSLAVGRNTFFVEGRYTLGLTNVANEEKIKELVETGLELAALLAGEIDTGDGTEIPDIDVDMEAKTKGIQIMAGFCMPLGG
ncbi:PorT family protein [bacterium]|nr:PorT family protein [bacterium]